MFDSRSRSFIKRLRKYQLAFLLKLRKISGIKDRSWGSTSLNLCEITYRKNWAELKSKRANSQPREGEIRYTQGSPRDAELVELMRQHPSCPTMNTIQRHSLRLGSELPQPHNPDLKKILLINSHLTLRGTKIWNRD